MGTHLWHRDPKPLGNPFWREGGKLWAVAEWKTFDWSLLWAIHLHALSFNYWTFTKPPSPNLRPFVSQMWVLSCPVCYMVRSMGDETSFLHAFRASCKSPEQASLKVTPLYWHCQSPLIDMKFLLGSYIWIWRPIHLPPVVAHSQVNHLMTYFIKKMSHKGCLCDLCSPLTLTLFPKSTPFLEHLQNSAMLSMKHLHLHITNESPKRLTGCLQNKMGQERITSF